MKPQPLTGSSTARAESPASPVSPARAGQVPRGERAQPRLCILSAPLPTVDGEVDRAVLRARLERLAALGLGAGLALAPAERAELGWKRLAALLAQAGELGLPQGFVMGASSEQAGGAATIGDQLEAVVEQCARIEEHGGVPLVLPFPSLSRRRCREEEYVEVYRTLLARVGAPVLIDFTGARVRPELLDYFPGKSFERVMALEPAKVRGARFALLDVARETRLRRELAARDQLLFTADRAHLAHLLLGANPGTPPTRVPEPLRFTELAGHPVALGEFSHALLELSASTLEDSATRLGAALERLAAGDAAGVLERMPTFG
jgi:uncharacterized protein DUF993